MAGTWAVCLQTGATGAAGDLKPEVSLQSFITRAPAYGTSTSGYRSPEVPKLKVNESMHHKAVAPHKGYVERCAGPLADDSKKKREVERQELGHLGPSLLQSCGACSTPSPMLQHLTGMQGKSCQRHFRMVLTRISRHLCRGTFESRRARIKVTSCHGQQGF